MSSTELEKRITVLEADLANLKRKVEGTGIAHPWWERIAGTFEKDAVYQKAMKLGRQYRQSLRPGKSSPKT